MPGINFLAVLVAAVAAFVASALWYSPLLTGKEYVKVRTAQGVTAESKMPPGKIVAEFARELIIALVLAHFIVGLGVTGWMGALHFGLIVWIGFWATILLGGVIHEKMPWKLYAIHAGDGFLKIILMSLIIGVWR